MSKEALKLALESLELEDMACRYEKEPTPEHIAKAITALREALANEALDRMAENARELGLDYEPAPTNCRHCGGADNVICAGQCKEQPAQEEAQRWAVFCAGCRKEWSVTYQHPGKSVCAECEAKLTAQQEPVAWRNAAIRVGEDLCSVGPFGYYDMTAEQWLDWALSVVTVHEPPHPQAREPEQPAQQEPVEYDKTELNCFAQDLYDQKMREGKHGHYESMFHVIHQCVKKVASPPAQRTWVGLTDEEVMVAAYQAGFDIHEDYENEDDPEAMHWWTPDGEACDDSLLKLRDLIEAKLKEKNNA